MHEINYKHLLAEQNSLEQMIASASNPNSMSIRSLKVRLKQITDEINAIDPLYLTKKAVITFRGKPVNGSKSISADFSAKALNGLTDMVASIVASANRILNHHGAIPNKNQHTLQITGVAVGSFGFELALPAPQDDLIDGQKNDTADTLTHIQDLLQYGINGTDEQIGDMIDVLHPRAIAKVNDFLSIMRSQEALFALQFNDKLVRIDSDEQLRKLIERLSQDNIHESDEEYRGCFIGVLPKAHTFEFQNNDESIIKGKISHQVLNPGDINHEYLDKPVTVKFHTTCFGSAKPKYELLDITHIS